MKTVILLIYTLIFSIKTAFAEHCFIAKQEEKILESEGDIDKRHSPCSTFKIVLSLIGYDSAILQDENTPKWPFKEGYADALDIWKNNQTPQTWIKTSCVWYSQVLTQKLGIEKFQEYIKKIDYGNQDLSGDKGKNNGLTHSWLGSSLQISSLEQVNFLEKMLTKKLNIKAHALEMTKNILFIEELKNGWKLYGKTGTGNVVNSDGIKNPDVYHGWFVGWIEKEGKHIIFSNHIEDEKKEEIFPSQRAKKDAKERLIKIIERDRI